MNKEIKFSESILQEGYLKKESPGIFKIYKTRYYAIRDKGNFLIWFKKKPTHHDQVPKGVIRIADISLIDEDTVDDTIIYINYLERKFKLKSQNKSDRDKWINALNFIKQYNKQVKNEIPSPAKRQSDKKQNWKWQNNQNELINKIQAENQQIFIEDTQVSDDVINPQKLKQILKNQGLIQDIFNEDLLDRIVFGFLFKKITIVGFKIKWFFLISPYNLRKEEDKRKLIFHHIPEWIKPNHIYLFDKSQEKHSKLHLKTNDIKQILIQSTQSPYKMVIKTQEDQKQRQHIFGSRYLSEIHKWEKILKIIIEREKQQKVNEQKKLKILENQQIVLECPVSSDYGEYMILKFKGIIIFKKKNQIKYESGYLIDVSEIVSFRQEDSEVIIFTIEQTRLKFENESKAKQVWQKIKEVTDKIKENILNQNNGQSLVTEAMNINQFEEQQENTFLNQKIKERRISLNKNYYQMFELSNTNEIKIEKKEVQQQTFWTKISKMFCSSG